MIISYKGVTPLGLFHIHIFAPPHIIVCCQPIELRLCCNRRYISLLMLANCRNTYSCKHPIIESIKVLDRVLSLFQKTLFHSNPSLFSNPKVLDRVLSHFQKTPFRSNTSSFSNYQSTRPSTFTLAENTVLFTQAPHSQTIKVLDRVLSHFENTMVSAIQCLANIAP